MRQLASGLSRGCHPALIPLCSGPRVATAAQTSPGPLADPGPQGPTSGPPQPGAPDAPPAQDITAIVHGEIIDGSGGAPIADGVVLVRGE